MPWKENRSMDLRPHLALSRKAKRGGDVYVEEYARKGAATVTEWLERILLSSNNVEQVLAAFYPLFAGA
jgi:hypothetical protein